MRSFPQRLTVLTSLWAGVHLAFSPQRGAVLALRCPHTHSTLLQMKSPHEQHQYHPGTGSKCRVSGPSPESETPVVGQATHFTRPSSRHRPSSSVRTTVCSSPLLRGDKLQRTWAAGCRHRARQGNIKPMPQHLTYNFAWKIRMIPT